MSSKRRPARPGFYTESELDALADAARYGGSAHHKTKPADYGLNPPVNPRPTKSLCDDVRVVLIEEANQLLRDAFSLGMVSPITDPLDGSKLPKYAWAVDYEGEVFEAKLGEDGRRYHGYRLGHDDKVRKWILREWRRRLNRET